MDAVVWIGLSLNSESRNNKQPTILCLVDKTFWFFQNSKIGRLSLTQGHANDIYDSEDNEERLAAAESMNLMNLSDFH